uniref:Uncharacterized protein n=1 Tax=viral metagenome TaxID=1070528 RepID=A0A6C0LD76_9ZZZZ
MSETLNVNVLVAAKEEYTKQLVYILSPEIYTIILNVFNESQQLKKKRSISLRNFQLQLKKIPVWNTIIIEKNTENIKSKFPYLLDLITAIFVSHVKILACVRLKTDSKSIQVKVPNLDTFLHKIIITIAEKIYYNPDIFLKKKEIVVSLISETIEETIRNQIPIDKILTEYLSGVFDEEEKQSKNETTKDNKSETDEELDEELYEDEELEEYDNESDVNEPDKSIFPTRPLPPNLLNNENDNENNVQNIGDIESKIPTEEIKNRVLFSDAIEKSVKSTKSTKIPNNEEESDTESDDDYSDIEEDSEEEPVK